MKQLSHTVTLLFTAFTVVCSSFGRLETKKEMPGSGAAVPVPSAAVGDLVYKHANFNETLSKFDTVQV